MTNIQLSTENLSFTYPDGTQALKNINIEIEKGEKVAIIGPNGAGKSTTINILCTVLDKKLELYFKIRMTSYLHQPLKKI